MPAKPLNAEQLADAARLKDAYTRAKERNPALTQAQLAYECGWGTQGTVSQYLLGKIPLNLDALLKFSHVLQIEPDLISPTLTERLRKAFFSLPYSTQHPELNESGASYSIDPTSTPSRRPRSNKRQSHTKSIEIRLLQADPKKDAALDMPAPMVEAMSINLDGLKQYATFSDPTKLSLITVKGDSMGETFSEGDILLLDQSVTSIAQDSIYAVALEETVYIKRFQRLPDGGLLMMSDNKKYEPYHVQAEDIQKFKVLGRIILNWKARKV